MKTNVSAIHARKFGAFVLGVIAGACGVGAVPYHLPILYFPAAAALLFGLACIAVPEIWEERK